MDCNAERLGTPYPTDRTGLIDPNFDWRLIDGVWTPIPKTEESRQREEEARARATGSPAPRGGGIGRGRGRSRSDR